MTSKQHQKKLARLALLSLFYFFYAPCFAQAPDFKGVSEPHIADEIKPKATWRFHLSPYFWMAGLSGHVNIKGNRANFSAPFADVRHDLDFSLGARFEAEKGPWGLLLDPDYVKVTQKPAINGLNGKVTYQTTITDGGVYYNLFSLPALKEDYSRAAFQILGGGRIVTFHTVIDFLNNASSASAADTSSIVVPLLGARLKYNLNAKVHTWLSGEFGGFQVSHVSSTWSGTVGIRYDLTSYFDLSLAYKALSVNYSIQAITINTLLQGPILSCGFSW